VSTSAPAGSGGLFATSTLSQPAQPSTTFTQQQQHQPAPLGTFTQQQQPAPLGTFTQQQQPAQAFGLSFTPAQTAQLSTFTQQPQQMQQQPSSLSSGNSVEQEFQNIMAAYNPQDARCRFRHPFYNLVPVEEAPRYQRPPQIPEGLWQEAVRSSPDPSWYVCSP
jgi:nuclear pore complex protein Nup54